MTSPPAGVDFCPQTSDGLATEAVNSVERRRSERDQRHTPAWLSGPTGSPSTAGRHVVVTDLSLHGVGFKSDGPMKRGEACWMVIARPDPAPQHPRPHHELPRGGGPVGAGRGVLLNATRARPARAWQP